jgi:hypothetical protein
MHTLTTESGSFVAVEWLTCENFALFRLARREFGGSSEFGEVTAVSRRKIIDYVVRLPYMPDRFRLRFHCSPRLPIGMSAHLLMQLNLSNQNRDRRSIIGFF